MLTECFTVEISNFSYFHLESNAGILHTKLKQFLRPIDVLNSFVTRRPSRRRSRHCESFLMINFMLREKEKRSHIPHS